MSEGNGTSLDRSKGVPDKGDREALIERAHEVENQLVRARAAINAAGVYFARHVHEYLSERQWEILGYDSPQEGLAHPGIEIGLAHAKDLANVFQALVLERAVPIDDLAGVNLRKLRIGLPAITSGERLWQDVVGDAKTLTRPDMAAKYQGKRGPNAPLDATAEPERCPCPVCGSWVEKDKIVEAA